jgi:hypothetical protein
MPHIGLIRLNLSGKTVKIVLMAAVFPIVFLAVFSSITLTQSPYSSPVPSVLIVNGMDITVGPAPNATQVPLVTAITIDALASASLSDLQVYPQTSITTWSSETTGPLTYKTIFLPSEPLKPATTYTITVTIVNAPATWSFTTTAEPFKPTLSYTLSTQALWISLASATGAVAVAGFTVWALKKRQKKTDSGLDKSFKPTCT